MSASSKSAYSSKSHPNRRRDDFLIEEKGITPADREEILSHINGVVDTNKISITDESFRITPQKKGIGFPIAINILSILAIGGAIYLANMFFQARQKTLSLESGSYVSAEGKLIEELKKESEEALQKKSEEINNIQAELSRLDSERSLLQENFDANLKEREGELRAALLEELDLERERMQALGTSAEEIEAKIQALKAEKERGFQQDIAAYKAESEAALQQKEEELTQAKALTEGLLQQVNEEKSILQEEALKREETIREQFAAERESLEEETTAAREELAQLASLRENEQFLVDQILSGYQVIEQNLNTRNYPKALEAVTNLETFLRDETLANVPAIAKRRETELFLVKTLKEKIEGEASLEDVDTASLIEAANRLIAAEEVISRAEKAYASGDINEAEDLYSRGIISLPALRRATEQLATIDAEKSRALLEAAVQRGNDLTRAGKTEEGAEAYARASLAVPEDNRGLMDSAFVGIKNIYQSQSRDLTEEHDENLEKLANDLGAEQEKSTLLEEKLAVRESAIDELTPNSESYQQMREEHTDFLTEVEALLTRNRTTQAVNLLTNYLSDLSSDHLTDLQGIIEETYRQRSTGAVASAVERTKEAAERLGRESALNDILLFTRYYAILNPQDRENFTSRITGSDGNGALFDQVIKEIRLLAGE